MKMRKIVIADLDKAYGGGWIPWGGDAVISIALQRQASALPISASFFVGWVRRSRATDQRNRLDERSVEVTLR